MVKRKQDVFLYETYFGNRKEILPKLSDDKYCE